MDSLHQQPQSPGIREILPAGLWQQSRGDLNQNNAEWDIK